MTKIFAALGWLLLFAGLGVILLAGTTLPLVTHRIPPRAYLLLAALGAAPGVMLWVIALSFARLPGARAVAVPRFGLAQGLWGMAGTVLMMFCGALLPLFAALYPAMELRLRHIPVHVPGKHDLPMLATSLLAGELLAGLFLAWYVRRQGPELASDGSASGIAWRAAMPPAYGWAALAAIIMLLAASLELHFVPPDMNKLSDMEMTELLKGPPIIVLLALSVVVCFAPVIEEMLFRGLAFAGIAAKAGPVWAVIITSIIFTALHAPEKIHYPLGFIDVGLLALMACGLRLRYHSIRPGMAMHFFYNFGMLLVPVIAGHI